MTIKELINFNEILDSVNASLINVEEASDKIIISTKNLETALVICATINTSLYDNYYSFNNPFNFSLTSTKEDFCNKFIITITI